MNPLHMLFTSALALTVAGTPALAADPIAGTTDRDWVTLSGKATSSSGDQFTLRYGAEGDGGETIIVEVDDFDMYDENPIRDGDQVTVSGRIDQGFFETRTVEASSVYIDRLRQYFFANEADEESGYYHSYVYDLPKDDEWIAVTGKVTDIGTEEFMLDTGARLLRVDTDGMNYDILAGVGDRVSVYGEMDDADLFEGREILASSVIVLSDGTS